MMSSRLSRCIHKPWLLALALLSGPLALGWPLSGHSQVHYPAFADIDGNGRLEASGDGRLVVMYLFGLSDPTVLTAFLGTDAQRDAVEVASYLDRHLDRLDVDGDGRVDALSDGLLFLRHLAGFSDERLLHGVTHSPLETVVERLALLTSTQDRDGDGVGDGQELLDGSDPNDPNDFRAADGATRTGQGLRFATLSELQDYLRLGADQDGSGGGIGYDDGLEFADVVAAPAAPEAGRGNIAVGDFSKVNIQEQGVDEADLMRSDGQYIYAVERGGYYYDDYIDLPVVAMVMPEEGEWTCPEGEVCITADDDDEVAKPMPPLGDGVLPPTPQGDRVRIMAIGADPVDLTDLGYFVPGTNTDPVNIDGLYLVEARSGVGPGDENKGSELVILGAGAGDSWGMWYWPYYWQDQEVSLYFADVSDPAAPTLTKSLHFQGGLIDSRVVDDTLYLVTRYYPPYVPVDAPATRDETIATTELLPGYRRDREADFQPIIVDGCYIEDSDSPRSAGMIHVIAIDLADAEHAHTSTCYAGEALTLYSSTEALYLAAEDYRVGPFPAGEMTMARFAPYEARTLIHKFAFAGLDVNYRGSAAVPGSLADSPREAALRLSEKCTDADADGRNEHCDLRVVTESQQVFAWFMPWREGGVDAAVDAADDAAAPSPVLLTILRDTGSGSDLSVIASLPNEQRPEVIGLAGERLYASRFLGDTLYLVTFRTIDPLYVIDLADPFDPYIAGELKIVGFSDYLHPVAEGLLLGIGKDALPDETGGGDSRGAWYQGLQVALFDVSDPTQPTALTRQIIGKRGTEAEVLHNHLAFAGMPIANGYRFAFSISLHENDPSYYYEGFDPSQPWTWYDFTHHGLYGFEVDLSGAVPSLHQLPTLVTTDQSWGEIATGTYEDRALLIGDAVHLYHDGQFWSLDYTNARPEAIGPR